MHLTDILIKNPLNLQASIYLFKVNDGNTRTISSKSLKKKDAKMASSEAFIINFEQISNCLGVSIVDLNRVNVAWVRAEFNTLSLL